MFEPEERKELESLSPDLIKKIVEQDLFFDRVKKSHRLSTYLTVLKQKNAWQGEIDENPFLVRGTTEELEIGEDGILDANKAKDVLKEALTSRQNVETVMKIVKLLPELDEQLEKLYLKLTVEEKEVARERAGEAEVILDLHLKSNGKN